MYCKFDLGHLHWTCTDRYIEIPRHIRLRGRNKAAEQHRAFFVFIAFLHSLGVE